MLNVNAIRQAVPEMFDKTDVWEPLECVAIETRDTPTYESEKS